MTSVTVAGGERTGDDDLIAAALEQDVNELLDHSRRHRRRLGQPGEDDGPTAQDRRDLRHGFGERGRIEEAERYALDAVETVGPQDLTSRATTATALAMVRAAQGRDDEAEKLFESAVESVTGTDFREVVHEILKPFAQFLRERGRDEEAAVLEERREALLSAAKSSARIA